MFSEFHYDQSPMERRTDEELLRAAHDGDASAFQAFCVRSLPTLYRSMEWVCDYFGIDQGLAHDFAHDAMVKALTHFTAYRSDSLRPLPKVSHAWLSQIGYHLIIDWLRRNQRYQTLARAEEIVSKSAPTTKDKERFEEVLKFLDWLDMNDRELLELVHMKGLKVHEAGEQLGMSRDAAYKAHERAMKRLQELIEEHGDPELKENLSRRR